MLDEGFEGYSLVLDLEVHQGYGIADILRDERGYSPLRSRRRRTSRFARCPRSSMSACRMARETLTISTCLSNFSTLCLTNTRDFDHVFHNTGVDVHTGDRLGGVSLTDDGLRPRKSGDPPLQPMSRRSVWG